MGSLLFNLYTTPCSAIIWSYTELRNGTTAFYNVHLIHHTCSANTSSSDINYHFDADDFFVLSLISKKTCTSFIVTIEFLIPEYMDIDNKNVTSCSKIEVVAQHFSMHPFFMLDEV